MSLHYSYSKAVGHYCTDLPTLLNWTSWQCHKSLTVSLELRMLTINCCFQILKISVTHRNWHCCHKFQDARHFLLKRWRQKIPLKWRLHCILPHSITSMNTTVLKHNWSILIYTHWFHSKDKVSEEEERQQKI